MGVSKRNNGKMKERNMEKLELGSYGGGTSIKSWTLILPALIPAS